VRTSLTDEASTNRNPDSAMTCLLYDIIITFDEEVRLMLTDQENYTKEVSLDFSYLEVRSFHTSTISV
jgi:hypothetical protein